MRSFRIIQTIASTRQDHGGTSRSVPALCNALVELGIDNHLLTSIPADSRVPCLFPSNRERVHLVQESAWPNHWGIGRKFRRELASLTHVVTENLVHDHAIWLPSNHAIAKYCRSNTIKRIVSPRGMLTPWAFNHGKLKKRLAWWLFQRSDLRSANVIHATSDLEESELRLLGVRQPIAVIPNGVDTPNYQRVIGRSKGSKKAVFIGRIHPKKGLPMLAQAWAEVNPFDWTMHVIGPDEGNHRAEVERQVQELGISKHWFFHGAIEGQRKWKWLSEADVTVLPTYSENFGLTVVESLIMGTPVITTTGAPWSGITVHRCGWWIEPTVNKLAGALREATRTDAEEMTQMGERGAEWVAGEFTWESVAQRFGDLYGWILRNGPTPSFVSHPK